MVIAMVTTGAVQVTGNQIIDMSAMGNGFMTASWAMLVL